MGDQEGVVWKDGVPYQVYRIRATGQTFGMEWPQCSVCTKRVSPDEADLDDDKAWPDEDTFVCRSCR